MDNTKELLQLLNNFAAFKANKNAEDMANLSLSQKPKVLVIACSDSRVDPAILAGADLGDIFVIRNVANIVPPYLEDDKGGHHGTTAAIEFAVNFLNVKHIAVLGHSKCGGVKALMDTDPRDHGYKYILNWVNIIKDAKQKAKEYPKEESYSMCEKEGILVSLENLSTFPFVRNKLLDDKIHLHGFYFTIETGEILYYNKYSQKFENIESIEEYK